MKKYLISAFLLFGPVCAFASEISGAWKSNFDSSYGPVQIIAEYKVSGEKISGTIALSIAGSNGETAIKDGVISGDTFEYSYSAQGTTISHQGKLVSANEIAITSSTGYEFTLKPVASKFEGTWNGSAETQYGMARLKPAYKVSGDKISGTIALSVAGYQLEIEIENGVVSGDTFKYRYNVQGTTISHEGKLVNDDEILIDSSSGTEFRLARTEE